MTDPHSAIASHRWSIRPTVLGIATAVVTSALAMALTRLRFAGYIGIGANFKLALVLAMLHFAVALWAAFKTRSLAWFAYVIATAIGFIAIGSITPIDAAILLLRIVLNV